MQLNLRSEQEWISSLHATHQDCIKILETYLKIRSLINVDI